MVPETPPEFPWIILGTIITAVITGIVGLYTARSARLANKETSQIAGWQGLVKGSREEITALRKQQQEDNEQKEREISELRQRLDDLTTRFELAEYRERRLIEWAKDVVKIMRERGISFPPPPPGVEDTDEHDRIS